MKQAVQLTGLVIAEGQQGLGVVAEPDHQVSSASRWEGRERTAHGSLPGSRFDRGT